MPWWKRLLGLDHSPERAARRTWRRSLPIGYRVRRWVGALLVICLLGGGIGLIGRRNPISWIVEGLNNVRDVQVPVTKLVAVTQPDTANLENNPGSAAIDAAITTAWAVDWSDASSAGIPTVASPAQTPCPHPVSATAGSSGWLLLTFEGTPRITAIEFSAGLPAQDPGRLQEPRPHAVQIGTADSCQTVVLDDKAEAQQFRTDFTTSTMWIRVLDVFPTTAPDPVMRVSITKLRVLARP